VGTAPGKDDVVCAEADSVTGRRRRVALGNSGERSAFLLVGLRPGTYYWSVQAIDHAWEGGAFAPEESFVVSEAIVESIRLEAVHLGEDGRVSLNLCGSGVTELILESSINLESWTVVSTNALSSACNVVSVPFTNDLVRFFRARSRP
jgi:hypothetical protein